jgi:hypothetical protein
MSKNRQQALQPQTQVQPAAPAPVHQLRPERPELVHFELLSPCGEVNEWLPLPRPYTCKGQIWVIRSSGTKDLLIGGEDELHPIAVIRAPGGALVLISIGDVWMMMNSQMIG